MNVGSHIRFTSRRSEIWLCVGVFLFFFQDLDHHLALALNEVQAAKKTWFNRTLSSIKTVTGAQGKETT